MFPDYPTKVQQLMTQNHKSDLHMHLTAQIASFISEKTDALLSACEDYSAVVNLDYGLSSSSLLLFSQNTDQSYLGEDRTYFAYSPR